ncbi:TetR/AcrR family transcriptional regulator [Nocardioides sp. T2.26MG-1]|uniref:TetR/AcrR family transcriptional regulator n=1 Tax=Nocardioides sp. T2.26MG-1 TaxID=3041166 RepID=UPI0024774357|nr:TetR/AcrR family transcriptional regulator [Nocardioides sp. T2.26MG-1]CAI9399693.1 putative HTH-type transcriptional regulator YfiR [Nocardioides sp. T2.26MG-1]
MPKVSDEHRAAQILDAAMRLAATEGFHRMTMAEVVAVSGLSAGAVYGYFRSKQELVRAIAQRAVGRIATTIDALADAEPPVPPAEGLEAVLDRLLGLSDELGYDVPALAIQGWSEATRDPEVREILGTELLRVRRAWRDFAERVRDRGLLSPEADVDAVGNALMAMLPGFIVFRTVFGDVTPRSHASGVAELMRQPPSR